MNDSKQKKLSNLRFIGRLLKPIIVRNRRLVLVFFIFGIVASIMEGLGAGLVLPLLEGIGGQVSLNIPFPFNVISGFFSGMDSIERVRWVALFLVTVVALKGVALYLNSIYICRMGIEFVKYYRMRCFDQLMKVGMEYIDRQKAAHLQTIIIPYTDSLGAIISHAGSIIPKMFTIGVLLIMLLLLSWKMTLVALVIVIVVTAVLRNIALHAEKSGKKYTASLKGINWALLDAIQGMKVIRLFRRETHMTGRFESEIEESNKSLFSLAKARMSVPPLFESLGMIGLALILVAGSFFLLSKGKPAGMEIIFTFIVIFIRILSPAMAFNQARVAIRGDIPSYREVDKFIDSSDKPYIVSGKEKIEKFRHGIEFRDVSFKYSSRETAALENVSFKVPLCAKVGIVGASGSGKSTVVELLLRFYDPQKGKIVVNGVDLKDLDLYSWRSCVGVVTQDTFLFHDTVRANISYANPQASQEEVELAAVKAYARDFIRQLPQGYDTIVGDRGVLLSGGQKQRIAIARAVLMNPDIFVFDEATSALDTESEEIVQKALYEVSKGKTVITIAHRLSTVYGSDHIIVFDEGKIVGQDTHQELMRQGGAYSKLVYKQTLGAQISHGGLEEKGNDE